MRQKEFLFLPHPVLVGTVLRMKFKYEKALTIFHRKGLNFLVAGKGFEPMTFGL